jgi:Fe-S cluster assembly iron-binding protein IscA
MIDITDTARDKLQDVLNENHGKCLRIFLNGIGWGGPRLGLALEEPKGDEDIIQVNSIKLLISDEVKPIANMNKIDYMNSPYGEGLIIIPKSGQPSC